MSTMEWRAWIKIPGLDIESEAGESLLVELERGHGDLGPVLSGDSDGVKVVLGVEEADEARAAGVMYDAVVDGLRAAGLGNLYPAAVEMEPADDLVPA